MKDYIKNNLTALLIGVSISNFVWMVFSLIESVVVKIAILITK